MKSDRVEKASRADAPDALDLALERSHEVKAKVETCADDLASANEIVNEQSADTAMYRAKDHGGSCVFFDSVEKESTSA